MMIKYINFFVLLFTIIFLVSSCNDEDENPLASDVTAPSLSISFPGFTAIDEGTPIAVSQEIQIKIDAEDANGIEKIEAFIDNEKVGEDITPPFEIIIDLLEFSSKTLKGNFQDYTLKIVATDKAGNTSSKEQIINIDNEMPVITEVSVEKDMVLQGDVNAITFKVLDNEGIAKVNIYINDNLTTEITEQGELMANIDTSMLSEGQNSLRIEAIDLAENKAVFEVDFIVDNVGPEINLQNLTKGMIIDTLVTLNPIATDTYSDVASLEIKFNDKSIFINDTNTEIKYEFNSEDFAAGEASFVIVAIDAVGNTNTIEVPVYIHRRLITINIPENRINEAITVPVVFISRMDGSLVVSKEILREDRQIILSTPEEFDVTTEFMLSFYLQDNSNTSGISTHQNLTRNNPKILNLKEPIRHIESSSDRVPTTNFFTNDVLIGNSGRSRGLFRSLSDAAAGYNVFLNTSENGLNISSSVVSQNPDPFDSFYVYDLNSLNYVFIPNPVDENFQLDKVNLSDTNLESRELVVNSQNVPPNSTSVLSIYGAVSQEDDTSNKFHDIYSFNRIGILDTPMEYSLNNSFFSYRHALQWGNYFTERKGPPTNNYQIPDVVFDYTFSNNKINLSVQGTDHIVGRAQCIDFDNLTYDWYITFKSADTSTIIIPELPKNIAHPVATAQKNGNIKVESVELLSYESILTYDDYVRKIVKDQTNVLTDNEWYQLIYSSRTGNFNIPNRGFIFQ